MNREQLYNIYQTNLELLENELVQVKRMAQANLGKLCYAKLEEKELGEIQKREKDVLGITRLYTFLLCSWLEARIKKYYMRVPQLHLQKLKEIRFFQQER